MIDFKTRKDGKVSLAAKVTPKKLLLAIAVLAALLVGKMLLAGSGEAAAAPKTDVEAIQLPDHSFIYRWCDSDGNAVYARSIIGTTSTALAGGDIFALKEGCR